MSEEDNAGRTDVSEMRASLDAERDETSESVSYMQEPVLERQTFKMMPETAEFRIREYEFGDESKLINLEYYEDYYDAMDSFEALCNDDAFINHYGKLCTIEVSKRVTGYVTDIWEVITQTTIYPETSLSVE